MKMLHNTEDELKKGVAYRKECVLLWDKHSILVVQLNLLQSITHNVL